MGRTILVAGVGMSPAVLTETVWALAQESPPVVPDSVIAITTATGAEKIREVLLDSGAWENLRKTLKRKNLPTAKKLYFGATETLQIIGDGQVDFQDIATPEQNRCAADFILRILRQYSEDPSTQIIASIAGGRKTMSALMLSCMNLLGRKQDRVCHVLANDNYIFKHKNFLFPQNKREEKATAIQLSDIPFVRVRGLYQEKKGEAPASYSDMVELFHKATPPAINYPKIELLKLAGKVLADGEDLRLSPKEFLLTAVLLEHFLANGRSFPEWKDVALEIQDEVDAEYPFEAGWHEKALEIDIGKTRWSAVASDIRKKRLRGKPWATALLPSPGDTLRFPKSKIKIRKSADIRKTAKSGGKS